MEKIISFIVENHNLLILLAACLLDVILFLCGVFKKKRNISLEEILLRVPHLVFLAEQRFGKGNGDLKKKTVLGILVDMYEVDTGVKVLPGSSVYAAFEHQIEKVLETPQKKGK